MDQVFYYRQVIYTMTGTTRFAPQSTSAPFDQAGLYLMASKPKHTASRTDQRPLLPNPAEPAGLVIARHTIISERSQYD